jgi:predicted ATPase
MLIRLRVNGFKSLEQVDVRFGPMTILVGPNDSHRSEAQACRLSALKPRIAGMPAASPACRRHRASGAN